MRPMYVTMLLPSSRVSLRNENYSLQHGIKLGFVFSLPY